jgi:hypothetical protein
MPQSSLPLRVAACSQRRIGFFFFSTAQSRSAKGRKSPGRIALTHCACLARFYRGYHLILLGFAESPPNPNKIK